MKSTKPELSTHDYDGIREYDNPTPGWWHFIFLGTVIFSWFYYMFAQFSPMVSTPEQAWADKQVAEYKRIFGAVGDLKNDVPTLLSLQAKSDMMSVAQGMYQSNCAQCHAKDGGGINGVNLTDDHYKNVKTLTDFYEVITNGAANGAMPNWRAAFSENERILLASYAASMRGTRPAAGKAAEGEILPPWLKEAPPDAGSNPDPVNPD